MDLNSDLGEGFGIWKLGDDNALLSIITSANVACGFHAGDPSTMRRVCEEAARNGVRIGAQVSYRDLAGFGRRFIDADPVELADEVLYQIGALDACARAAGTEVVYVKPHGALYNATVHHEKQAEAVVNGAKAFGKHLPILGLPGSELLKKAVRAGLRPVQEAFADRGYTPQGTLVPRSEPNALLTATAQVIERATRLLEGEIVAVDGTVIKTQAESLCVHGDTPGAVEHARAVKEALGAVTPFV
jgi:UPF0271 protein